MSTAVVWVDSRRRASRASDSEFEVGLRETIHMSNARLRIDKVTFTDSFLTMYEGGHLFFSEGSGGLLTYTIPEGAYTGQSLAAAIHGKNDHLLCADKFYRPRPGRRRTALAERQGAGALCRGRLACGSRARRPQKFERSPRRRDQQHNSRDVALGAHES